MQKKINNYRLYGWGKSYTLYQQILKNITIAATGQNHLIFVTNANQVYGIGSNKFGQLALNGRTYYQQPERIVQKYKIQNVFCGAQHTFFITDKHQVYSVGLNIKGQLGLGTFENINEPKLVLGLLPFGKANPKSLNSNIIKQPKPLLVQVLQRFDLQVKMDDDPLDKLLLLNQDQYIEIISCGSLFTIVLSNKGRVFGCGYQCTSASGQNSQDFIDRARFKQIVFDQKIIHISSGLSGAAALTKQGYVYFWGKFGKIRNNIPKRIIRVQQSLNDKPQLEQYVNVQVGDEFLLLLSIKGQVYSLGQNIDNQLGIQARQVAYRDQADKIASLNFFSQIWVGRNSAFALSMDKNQLYGWGSNRFNQISPLKSIQTIQKPTQLSIYLQKSAQLIPSSYCNYILSINKLTFPQKIPLKQNQQQQMIKLSEYKKLLNDYQILKNLNLTLLEKLQPSKKQTKQIQTSSKFQVNGVTKYRKFNTNLQIDWKQLNIQNQISQGGYGIIYKAKWRQTIVAVKKFKIENGDVSVRDFLSQCHAMEAVRHPNIVMFLGAVIKPPNYCIVLEYCSKGSLWSYLQNLEIVLPWEERRRIAIQIAQGVLYLHLCNPPILHRDLKSLNIFLDSNYKTKIGDFGWTKTLDQYMTNKIGTYQWMAPEVIGNKPYTEKADVFSYSIILWEIASRQPPYKNITGTKVSEGVLNNDLRPLIPKKTPQAFAKLMKKCWESDPNKRPTFKQIIRELQIMKL